MSPCPILHPRQTILGCNNHLLVETCRMCRDPSSPVCVWQGKSGVQGPLRKNNNHFTSSPPHIALERPIITLSIVYPHWYWKSKLTLKSKLMISMEMTAFLAKFCRVPVRKACGKKNPEIQKTGGIPSSIQPWMNFILSSRSSTQVASGLREG